jgi:hypothetical protein
MSDNGHVILWTNTVWRKSSRSAAGDGNCVEICVSENLVGIRDSKAEPGGPVLAVSRQSFRSFIGAAKSDAFERPMGGA